MDPNHIGQFVGAGVAAALVAWLIIRAVVKTVRYNIIKKNEGVGAAKEFWDAKKARR